MRTLTRVALAGLLCAVLPATANAYVFISTDGCGGGRGAAWPQNQLPTEWFLNQGGYSTLQFSTIETLLSDSLSTWAAPCCSGFSHAYQGTTTDRPMDFTWRNTVGFEESTWPRELGSSSSVIAVTMPIPTTACQIVASDMIFNGVGFSFRVSGAATDLQSIATHEFGHWLGLDHTTAPGATMLAYYSGGTSERSLTQDDQDGVCALYPRSCTGCTADSNCPAGQRCVGGTCEIPSCQSSADCALGTICSGGACVPGCRTDNECQAGYTCQTGSCRRPPGSCTICASCAQNSDCGGFNYYCVDLGNGGSQCTKICQTDADCDGDSKCWSVDGGDGNTYQLCFNPDANVGGLCPSGYVCEEPAVNQPGCVGLWDLCTNGGASCGTDSDLCIDYGGRNRCTCTCATNADCGDGASCARAPSGQMACFPNTVLDPCTGIVCGSGEVCRDGACVGPCDGVSCPAGQTCQGGVCVDDSPCGTCPQGQVCKPTGRCGFPSLCDDVSCPAGQFCDPDTGRCGFADPCEGVSCPAGADCVDGQCVPTDPCAGVQCEPGAACQNGTCVADPCFGVACNEGFVCENGSCVGDPCAGVQCNPGFSCVNGGCIGDPCAVVSCNAGFVCQDGLCVSDPNPPPRPRPSTASGEADTDSGCSAGGGAPGLGALLLAGLALLRRRRAGPYRATPGPG